MIVEPERIVHLDPPVRALLDTIRAAGFVLDVQSGERVTIEAVESSTGHRHVVTGSAVAEVAVELAVRLKLDLEG